MRRELSVASKREEVLQRADLASSILRAASGVRVPRPTREFQSSRDSVEALLRDLRLEDRKESSREVGDSDVVPGEILLPEVEETKVDWEEKRELAQELELPPATGVVDSEGEEDDEEDASQGLPWFDDELAETRDAPSL